MTINQQVTASNSQRRKGFPATVTFCTKVPLPPIWAVGMKPHCAGLLFRAGLSLSTYCRARKPSSRRFRWLHGFSFPIRSGDYALSKTWANTVRNSSMSMGLVRWVLKPALIAFFMSLSCPQPVAAINQRFVAHAS